MKRALLITAAAGLALALLWFCGKPPSRYVLERECERFQQDRRTRDAPIAIRIAKLEQEGIETGRRDPSIEPLKQERDRNARAPHRTRMRGWDVILIPAGAKRPDPENYLVYDRYDPAWRFDPPRLRGAMEIWIQPSGGLAKLVSGLGLGP